MSKIVKLEPWIKGIQNKFDPTKTPPQNVIDAVNVDIQLDGSIHSRPGYTLLASDAHSLFEHNNQTYAIYQNKVCRLLDDSVDILSSFNINNKVNWTVINNEPVFTNESILGKVIENTVVLIGVDKPVVTNNIVEGAPAYAYSYINIITGEEGPLSLATTQVLSSAPSGFKIKTYSNETGAGNGVFGDELFGELGDIPITQNCNKMPGGTYPEYWRGRLLIARGRTLFVSKSLHYGVYEEDAGVFPFEGKILFLAGVENGVYVAVKGVGVYFLKGSSPEEWTRVLASNDEVHEGAVAVIPPGRLGLGDGNGSQPVAVWFTQFGFTVGLPSGQVTYPQKDSVSNLPIGRGSIYYNDGRLTILYS